MKKILMLTLALVWCVVSVQAQTLFWVSATSGNWSNPANWGAAATGPGGAGVPTSGMNVSFTNNFNGNCTLDVAASVVNITVNGYTGTIDLNGNTLSNTGTGTFTTGTISNTGAAAFLTLGGTTTTFNGTLFNADINGSSGILNFNGSVFNGTVAVTKTGATNDNGTGGNSFNGAVTFTNTGSTGQMQLGNVNPDIFNGILTLNINGTSAIALGRVAAGNQYNQNIVINYNSTGTVAIGSQGGSGTLLAGRTITVGSIGASGCGHLTLARFNAPSAQTITLAGNSTALLTLGPASTFGSTLTATSPGIILNSSTFQGVTQLTKTGSTDDGQRGGNVFNGVFTLNHNGDADFRFGSNAADAGDIWNADATFNNTSGNRIRVGELSSGNVFMANATFNALGGGTDVADRIQISRLTGAETTFNGTTTFNNQGATSDIQISFDAGTLTTFNGPVFYNETTTGVADDQIGNEGNVVINNNITISNTSSNIIYMSAGGGSVTFGNGVINVGASFATGQLRIRNFTQTGNSDQSITLTGTALLRVGPNTTFNGSVDFRAPQLQLDGATYNGAVNNFEKTGATNNNSAGGNIFNNTPTGTTTITNSGSGYLVLGNDAADHFNGITTFNNTGSYRLYFAHNHPGQTTTFTGALTINSAKSSGTDPWSILMAEYGTSAVTFGGPVTLNCSGAIRSDIRFLNGTGSTATYAGIFTIANTNSHTATTMNIGSSGVSTYNHDIVISNSNGPTQMLFNVAATASSTLAGTRTISTTGFADGILSLPRFTQIGSTQQTLNMFSGTATLIVGPNSAFGGNVDFKAPQIYLNGCNYGGTATIEKTGATNNASTGGNVFGGVTILTNTGSGYLMIGNGNPDQFSEATTFNNNGSSHIAIANNHANQTTTFFANVTFNSNKTGSGDQYSFQVCESANTRVDFGGSLTINCLGSFRSDHRFLQGTGSTAAYADALTINLSNSNSNTAFTMGANGVSTYDGNISVTNYGGASGIFFNTNAAASATLAANRTIALGANGFSSGTLSLIRFTQTGNTLQTLNTFSGTALLVVGPASAFGGDVNFRAPQMLLNGCTYSRTAYIEKNGAGDNTGNGGDIFHGVTTLVNSGSGSFELANTLPETFNTDLTVNNTGTYRIQIGINAANNVFNGTTTFNHSGTASAAINFIIARNAGSSATFNGPLFLNCSNGNNTSGLIVGNDGNATINGNITVSNTGNARGIFLAAGGGTVTLGDGFTIKDAGVGTFTTGTLNLSRFTQLGIATPQTVRLTGTALMNIVLSQFNSNVDFRAPQVVLSTSTFQRVATIEKSGATDNSSPGGNIFNGVTTLTNSGSAYFMMGNGAPDQFNGATTFNNTGSYRIYIAYAHSGQTTTFGSDLTLNANKTGGTDAWAYLVGDGNGNRYSVAGTLTINVAGTLRSDIRFLNGTGTTGTYNGNVVINSTNSHASTAINMGVTGISTYNGNISVTNVNGGTTSGTFFNTGASASSIMAATKAISIGGGGFTNGTLSLVRFTQTGNTAQTMALSGVAVLTLGPSIVFDGNVDFRAPQVYLQGGVYNGTATIEKNGATPNDSNGGNTFNGTTTITSSGAGRMRLSTASADTYNGSATFVKSGAGAFDPAYAFTNTFAGDITTNGATTFTFGTGSGVVEFTGSNPQAVSMVGSSVLPTFQRIRMNKTSGAVTANTVINVGLNGTFTSGVINTTATNYLNFADDATATGANDLSYVNGPVRKTGNDAFTFPVGGDNYYRPIGMSAPGNVAHHFTAQYFHAAQTFGDKTTWDPTFWTVSACDYWTLDRTGATPMPAPTVTVTLSWNDAICGGTGYITSLPGLRVTRWDAATSKWVNHGNGSTSGSASNGTITSAGAVTTFSPFALASVTRLNPLPVELTDFHATDLGATVSLDWTTASELNSKSFTLQRSQNGLDYNDLTEIAAAGTKITTSRYNFIDESPYGGRSYYRLKQTDYNGDVSYPGITSIQRAGESAAFNAYPNPAGNEVVHFTQKANITIINSLNQEIGSAQGVTNIDVSGLKAGVYIIRNQNGQVVKLVKK